MYDDNLVKRQEAAAQVERRMMEFLIQYHPARELRLADACTIAAEARHIAFDMFSSEVVSNLGT
jgi:hypothetical protein